jgi:sporulation protein YlmC with PRC-barrel domain
MPGKIRRMVALQSLNSVTRVGSANRRDRAGLRGCGRDGRAPVETTECGTGIASGSGATVGDEASSPVSNLYKLERHTMEATSHQIMSSDTLRKDKVRNISGEDLGKIEDFMLDMDTGRIQYAVLSFGGVMGIGNKLFAVPPQALRIDTKSKCLVLDADKENLEHAPGFDKDHWPSSADRTFAEQVYRHYGQTPYWS